MGIYVLLVISQCWVDADPVMAK